MIERRRKHRDKVIYGATVDTTGHGATLDCIVRDLSCDGARVEFGGVARLPDEFKLTINRVGRAMMARIVWWRANIAGLAFSDAQPSSAPDLEHRLRASERKRRLLQHRVKVMTGEA